MSTSLPCVFLNFAVSATVAVCFLVFCRILFLYCVPNCAEHGKGCVCRVPRFLEHGKVVDTRQREVFP